MKNSNSRYHNDGPIGERDYEDAGSRYSTPSRPLSVGKAPTASELKVIRAKEDVVIARMVADYTKTKGFAPNAIMMTNIRRDAAREAKS
jgi:hypothetical protein